MRPHPGDVLRCFPFRDRRIAGSGNVPVCRRSRVGIAVSLDRSRNSQYACEPSYTVRREVPGVMRRLSYFRKIAGRPEGSPILLAPAHHPFRRGEPRASGRPEGSPILLASTHDPFGRGEPRASAEPPQAAPGAATSPVKGPHVAAARLPDVDVISRPQEAVPAQPLWRPPPEAAFAPRTATDPERPSREVTALPPSGPAADPPPAGTRDRQQSIETIAIHENRPEPMPGTPTVAAPRPRIEIGSIEIEIVPPAAAPTPKPASPSPRPTTAIRRSAPAPLARDFGSTAGLRQG